MKLYEISAKCNVDEAGVPMDYEIEVRMKEPNISFILDLRVCGLNWSNNIENLIKAITSSAPQLSECLSNYASKNHAEFMKEYSSSEEYQEYIKWFPENA